MQTDAQLREVVNQVLTIEPAQREVQELENQLSVVRQDLNAAIPAIKERNVDQMGAILNERLKPHIEQGEKRFTGEFWTTDLSKKREQVAEFERRQFDRMKDAQQHLSKLLAFDREHRDDLSDALQEERSKLVGAWDSTREEHNKELERFPSIVDDCLDELA